MNTVMAYLFLITFCGSALQGQNGINDWKALAGSPYDGYAVRLVGGYYLDPLDHDKLLDGLKKMKKESGLDPWPWIFLNRMIGTKKDGEKYKLLPEKTRSRLVKIKGMDIFGEAGELDGFLDNWKTSLVLAREVGAPGVALDVESYNDYGMYDVRKLADAQGKTVPEVVDGLKQVGARMADIAAKEYPDAKVLSYFIGMTRDDFRMSGHLMSVSYILLGFLERCADKKYGLKLIAGGEVGLGYCSRDLASLKAKIDYRDRAYERYRQMYPDSLVLGGIIAPWGDAGKKDGWLKMGECVKCDIKNIEGFTPYFKTLASEYNFISIYAARKANYDPFNAGDAAIFNPVIKREFKTEKNH